MEKIAIFTEGQTELIFVREVLNKIADLSKISFECIKFHANQNEAVPYEYKNPVAEIHFMIVNVENDNKVLSVIKDREKALFSKGYSKIIGLRDMYSDSYKKKSPNSINESLNEATVKAVEKEIKKTSMPSNISFHFAIMEMEAWLISLCSIFYKINKKLSVEYIENKLGFNIKTADPQKELFQPSIFLNNILNLVNADYKKKKKDIEIICSHIDASDLRQAYIGSNCENFKIFLIEIVTCLNCYTSEQFA